jgi:hypothetical protein
MKQIRGGGRPEAAAATFFSNNIYEVYNLLVDTLYKTLSDDIVQEEPEKRLVLIPNLESKF